MAVFFDPTRPVDNSLIASQELRDRFNSLDQQDTDLNNPITERAYNRLGVTPLAGSVSDPPSHAEMTALKDKINEPIAALNA